MKNLAIIFAALAVLGGCQKDDVGGYVFMYEGEGSRYGLTFYLEEYKSEQCVDIKRVANPEKRKRYFFEASKHAEYVVVRIVMGEDTNYSRTLYVSNVFYVDNKNTEIFIDPETQVQEYKP